MRTHIRSFFCIMLTLLFLLGMQSAVFAAEETPTIKVALSEDESIIVERILYTALKQSGFQMVTKAAGMRTTVSDVNYGDAAIIPAQTIGLEEEYPNLIRVPVPISYVETHVYTRSEESYQFKQWNDLKGLRLSHCWKNLYITRNVPRAQASEVVTLNEYEDLWDSLLAGKTDVAVIPNSTGFVRIVPNGVKLAGIIEREPRYTYVNKEHEYLVALLTSAYQEMTSDGTMEMIRTSSQSGEKKVVLHISSYSTRIEWERREIEAIRKGLDNIQNLEYHNFSLSSRQVPNQANMNTVIANAIRTNFIERNPDLIIVSDNVALEFVLNNYYMLFPKVPVVFCGVNDFDFSMLHGFEEYVTGVSESISFDETVTEMMRLYPKTKKIYILNDHTRPGLEWRESLQKSIEHSNFSVEYEFSENKPFDDILKDIRNFDTNTLVLLATYFLDGDNAFYSEQRVQEAVCSVSRMPVFCLANSFHGYGTLGGLVSVAETQGEMAAFMAQKILSGTKPSEIPVILESSSLNSWQFDHAVAKQFGISTKSLPEGHIVLNRKFFIWESNPFEFGLAITILISFLSIIIGLVLFLRLMRQKNMRLLEIQSNLHSAEELLEKDNDLRKMIDSLPVPVLIVDIETCKIEYGNQAFLTANDFTAFEQAKQMDLSLLVETVFDLWQDKSVSFHYGSLREPDSSICQRISAEEIMYYNKNCFLFISEDITAQLKENEMLARAAQKEKEANVLKGRFLANMSHEIRTPMNAIIGLAQLALIKPQTPENESFFSKIMSSAKNLLSIINDILDFSKIEAEKLDLVEEEFLLEDTVSNAFMVAADRMENKPLELILDMSPDVPCCLYGDSTRLWQVLKNLLDNAVKYTPAGQVTLLIGVAEADSDSVSLCFQVCDTGIGMTKEELERLFIPFEQMNQPFKTKKTGTGLGMSITKQLVELMRGRIEVNSQVGVGTEFSIVIPFKLPPNIRTMRDILCEYGKKSASTVGPVLLINSNAALLRVMDKILERSGIPSVPVYNLTDAFTVIDRCEERGSSFQTVIIDYQLGNEEGLDAARKIKAYCYDARLLLMTNYMKHLISPELLHEAGIADIIEKPFIMSSFLQKVCKIETELLPKNDGRTKYPKARVLLCEDIEINQMIAENMLNEFDISPMIVSNGQEAIAMLKTYTFDLIFMDIIMPVMDGHEAIIAIRQSNEPYRDTPICALTANVMHDEIQQCMSEGVNAYLEKPLDFDALGVVLADILAPLADG